MTNQEPIYYITVGLAAAHFLKQIVLLKPNSPESCYKQFKSNNNQIQHQIQFNFIQILKKQQNLNNQKIINQSIQTNQINLNSIKWIRMN